MKPLPTTITSQQQYTSKEEVERWVILDDMFLPLQSETRKWRRLMKKRRSRDLSQNNNSNHNSSNNNNKSVDPSHSKSQPSHLPSVEFSDVVYDMTHRQSESDHSTQQSHQDHLAVPANTFHSGNSSHGHNTNSNSSSNTNQLSHKRMASTPSVIMVEKDLVYHYNGLKLKGRRIGRRALHPSRRPDRTHPRRREPSDRVLEQQEAHGERLGQHTSRVDRIVRARTLIPFLLFLGPNDHSDELTTSR